jgi:uncharacterized membrane protein
MTTLCKAVLSLAALLLASVPLAMAQGTYTQIDVPGAASTSVQGIDNAGDLVGFYTGTSDVTHGFLFSGGAYTTIDYVGGESTYLLGINNVGQIVGYANPGPIGFSYDIQTQVFTIIQYPGALSTYPLCINDAGTIGGYAGFHGQFGFALIGSRYRRIVPPGTNTTSVNAISDSDSFIGTFGNTTLQNFVFVNGKYGKITIPNAASAVVSGTNKRGNALVGAYVPASNVYAGFLYQNETFTELEFPGSTYGASTGINDAGTVVGLFFDTVGEHGYTWTPPTDARKK